MCQPDVYWLLKQCMLLFGGWQRNMTSMFVNKKHRYCLWRAIRLCIPKKSASQRNYSKDDKIVADEFNNFFSCVGMSTINRIAKLAEKSNYTLNQCSFIPRIYPLSEQFTFNAVKCEQVHSSVQCIHMAFF